MEPFFPGSGLIPRPLALLKGGLGTRLPMKLLGCNSRSSSTACCCLWAAWSLPETTCRTLYFCMVGNFHCPRTKQTNRISIPGLLEIHAFCLYLFHLGDRCSICWSRSLWVPWTVAVHKLLAEGATASACGSQERMLVDWTWMWHEQI